MTDALIIADRDHKNAYARGSKELLNAIQLMHGIFTLRPVAKAFARSDFLWANCSDSQNQWHQIENSKNTERQSRTLAAIAEKNLMADSRRVSRDPCPMCGIRTDVGCRHTS